ncbi:retrovirus-related pol polyprotein from transposon TNT 1-94 [Tanacetum coccineum]
MTLWMQIRIDLENVQCSIREGKSLMNIINESSVTIQHCSLQSILYLGLYNGISGYLKMKMDPKSSNSSSWWIEKSLPRTLNDARTISSSSATNDNTIMLHCATTIISDMGSRFTTTCLSTRVNGKSLEEHEARENVALVDEHLAAEEVEKLVENLENVDDSSPPRHDNTSIPGTRLEPRSYKESPEVEIPDKDIPMVDVTNIITPMNVDDKEDEITDECVLIKEMGILSTALLWIPRNSRELTDTILTPIIRDDIGYKYFAQSQERTWAYVGTDIITDSKMQLTIAIQPLVDASVRGVYVGSYLQFIRTNKRHSNLVALRMKFETDDAGTEQTPSSAVRIRDQDDPHDDAHPEGENSAKRQKTSEYEAYVSGESSSGQVNVEEPGPSTSGNQEQDDEFDFWTDSYASDDDEIPTKQVTQDIMEEISLTIDEAKLKKMADEMLRQRCTSGDEHQYHIDQMKNFLQSDIVWESRKEILVSPHPRKITPLVQSCQRDPEAPALSLINQDLLYLKKGNSGPEKIVLSLHKFPAIVFNDDDIEERTSRWVNKCIKKFNPYARYGVENWKNPHAKIFYIRRQKEPGRPKEEIYSNSKIVQVIKTYWELGHEHKFITEIVARRANDCIVSITEPDYKNLNKNDIEDMYLLIMNNKVPDYANTGLLWSLSVFIRSSVIWERVHDFQLGIESYQQKINLTAPTITFPGIEEYDVFSIVYEPVHGIIYTNSKKEKRVMRPSEIHKFCDATLRRTLEGLKSYYNDVKYGYVQKELTNDEVEFLKLFEEEIEVRLNYRDQMRRWEIAYIATQPNCSQIKYEDITQIDNDDIEQMDIKWNLALLSMRDDRFWKKTGKKITIQGSDVAGFDKSKVECFNCHKMGHFARECRTPRSQEKGRRESYKKDPKVEEPTPKAIIAIDGIGWDWSYMADEDENHALVANEEVRHESKIDWTFFCLVTPIIAKAITLRH